MCREMWLEAFFPLTVWKVVLAPLATPALLFFEFMLSFDDPLQFSSPPTPREWSVAELDGWARFAEEAAEFQQTHPA